MNLCLETLCVQSNLIDNVSYHDARFNETRKKLFHQTKFQSLEELISIPNNLESGRVYRCRVLYKENIEKIEFIPYEWKSIRKVKLVEIPGDFDYTYKWANRSFFSKILSENAEADEVLMVKNGFITDCTIANVVLFDGKNWFTPSSPLSQGTRRAKLLSEKKIEIAEIKLDDLKNYDKLVLINTFRDLDETALIPVSEIF